MNNEYFSGFDTKSLDRFEGKHHVIVGLVLSSVFEGEDDIKNAFQELATE
ncbi:MAG TPA: hypothetical protein PK720_03405 [bacterium]|jgi:hypothetical protein|nr:hypothetical protein [bacterium]